MSCLNCGEPKTIEAHLLPKSFVSEVKGHPRELHLILHAGGDRPVKSHTGVYDRGILCSSCDSILGAHEGYAVELLRQARKVKAITGGIITFDPIDGNQMIRFAAGIAWKYGSTAQPGRIDIGPYIDIVRDVALRGAPIPKSMDLAMLRLLELDGDVYFYRTPLTDRKEGVNMVRFTVGSFLFFLKVDNRRNGSILPSESWLRGRSKAASVVVRADLMEEGRMHRALASGPPATGFFREMKARSARREK